MTSCRCLLFKFTTIQEGEIDMFKKFLSLLFSVVLLSSYTVAFAAQSQPVCSIETVYFLDGTYLQITTIVHENFARTSSTRVNKDYDYYAGGKLAIRYTLSGMFDYDGSTSKATGVSAEIYLYQSGWSLKSHREYCSGNRAYGTATFSGPSGNKTLGGFIACDKNGNIT